MEAHRQSIHHRRISLEAYCITHEKTVSRTPHAERIVVRTNGSGTHVEAAQDYLIFSSEAPIFLWAEPIATASYTQKLSPIHTLHNKTPYELAYSRHWGSLLVTHQTGRVTESTTNEPAKSWKPYVTFDELTGQTAPVHSSPGPAPNLLTPRPISSGLVPNPPPAAPYVPPTNKELEILFQPMFDDYFEPHTVDRPVPPAPATQFLVNPIDPSVSIFVDQDAPSGSHSPSYSDHQSFSVHHGVASENSFEVNPFAPAGNEPFVNTFAPNPSFEATSSRDFTIAESTQSTQPHEHL
ncbi:hypothetical protein Tco_0803274 [Tanacetum coccineum]|uniref:Uncharacterized protein n=1 Tax=Tanacetum coccineum TaxID=301880 RepID=A0ABQ5A3W1_9ASTR